LIRVGHDLRSNRQRGASARSLRATGGVGGGFSPGTVDQSTTPDVRLRSTRLPSMRAVPNQAQLRPRASWGSGGFEPTTGASTSFVKVLAASSGDPPNNTLGNAVV